jgi:hypothetical protein
MREQTKLEQILARQRQKLDEVFKKKFYFLFFILFRLILFVQYLAMKVNIRMNFNLFIIEFVNNNKSKNNDLLFYLTLISISCVFLCTL